VLSGAAALSHKASAPWPTLGLPSGGGGGVAVHVSCNYVEIYNDEVTCLLTGARCDVRRSAPTNGACLTHAAECPIGDLGEALRLLRAGQVRKKFAATAMNARSSRAHTVLVLHVRQARGDAVVNSTLHLVDLAGSERLKKSKAKGLRKAEAVGINESLMVLGKVIAALVESHHHVRTSLLVSHRRCEV
jgi:kinesin family protein C2/C3